MRHKDLKHTIKQCNIHAIKKKRADMVKIIWRNNRLKIFKYDKNCKPIIQEVQNILNHESQRKLHKHIKIKLLKTNV